MAIPLWPTDSAFIGFQRVWLVCCLKTWFRARFSLALVGVPHKQTHCSCETSVSALTHTLYNTPLPLLLFAFSHDFPPFFRHLHNPSLLQQLTSDIYYLWTQTNLPTRSDKEERRVMGWGGERGAELDFGRYYLFLRCMDVQGHRQQGKQRPTTQRHE